MLRGPSRLAHTALAWVCTTALGLLVVPDVNMMPNGSSGSAGRPGHAEASPNSSSKDSRVSAGQVRARRLAGVVGGDGHPLQRRARLDDHRRELRLGDGGHALCLVDEVGQLGAHRLGVGRHPDGADGGAGQPGQDQLGAVVGVDEDLVALADAPADQPGGQAPGVLEQLGIRPLATLGVRRVPDQDRVVRAVLGPVGEEPRDVLPVHLEFLECGVVHGVSMSEPQVVRAIGHGRPPSIAPCRPVVAVPPDPRPPTAPRPSPPPRRRSSPRARSGGSRSASPPWCWWC